MIHTDVAAIAGIEPFWTTKQAAEYLHYAPASLANMRAAGRGPSFVKPEGGQPRYRKSDIDAWLGINSQREAA
jgi:hypothetical protein